jgi:glycosyltransferase involved in cell wall biosynthesis
VTTVRTPDAPIDVSEDEVVAVIDLDNGVLRTVCVIIPARNEARNIGWVLDRIPALVDEVILVDGSSVDDTIEVARQHRPDIEVIRQSRRGKGNALAAGFEAATCDYVVMIDADGSMDPEEIIDYLRPLTRGADYAKGSRFTAGGGSDDITVLRRAGNKGLNLLTNILFGSEYSDLCYGYNAFTRECIAAFALPSAHVGVLPQHGDGFEIETMINVRVVKAGLVIAEVPSYEYVRRTGESNLNTFRDGFRVLRTIVTERLDGRRYAPARTVAAPNRLVVADPIAALADEFDLGTSAESSPSA